MSNSEPWTIKRLLEWTTDYLNQYGSESARLDAEVLLSEAIGCERIQLYTSYDQIPPEEKLGRFRGWIKERAGGKPVAYLVGHREFYSLPFEVNHHVLIPRPETELLVTLAIDSLKETAVDAPQVCDVGTGSGCVSIALAKNVSNVHLTAVDISSEAILIAEKNATTNKVQEQIQFIESDLFENLDPACRFDLIVSNPPYIGLQEKDSLAVDVRDHEPELALFGGNDGMDIINRLVDNSCRWLKKGGKLMMEISPIIAEACVGLLNQDERWDGVQLHHDLSKQPRVVSATRIES